MGSRPVMLPRTGISCYQPGLGPDNVLPCSVGQAMAAAPTAAPAGLSSYRPFLLPAWRLQVTKYVEREIMNHRSLMHPHIVQFKEVRCQPAPPSSAAADSSLRHVSSRPLHNVVLTGWRAAAGCLPVCCCAVLGLPAKPLQSALSVGSCSHLPARHSCCWSCQHGQSGLQLLPACVDPMQLRLACCTCRCLPCRCS